MATTQNFSLKYRTCFGPGKITVKQEFNFLFLHLATAARHLGTTNSTAVWR